METEGRFDVVVVGSCNVDLISYVDRLPKAGETICGSEFRVGCGGKGANQCVMAAKLGAKVAMVACLGDDSFGEMYLKNFSDCAVDARHVRVVEGKSTGVAPIAVNAEGENSIIIVKGANDCLSACDLRSAEDSICHAGVVLCQLEITPDVSLAALKMARESNVKTIFNPAPAITDLSPAFLRHSTILCCNETEAEILSGCVVADEKGCLAAVRALLGKGPEWVVLTMGAKGAMFGQSGTDLIQHVTPASDPRDPVVDSTGAGDCFVGSLAYFIAIRPDLPMEEVVRRAVNIASMSVRKAGTQTSYPTRSVLPSDLIS